MIRTFGHGTLAVAEFLDLVAGAAVDLIADVRRFPGSRRHPHFSSDAMPTWLGQAGIEYRWLPALGGRRKPAADSPNVAWRNEQFRAYADHMASAEFTDGVADLIALGQNFGVAVLCAESVWWRCHRRLLADYLVLIAGIRVDHLFHDGRLVEHKPAPEARVADGVLRYDRLTDLRLT